jgi:hypothetical protein
VRVALNRDEKQQESWRLTLEIDPPPGLLEQRRNRDIQQKELTAIRQHLAAYGKKDKKGEKGATAEQKRAAVEASAELLHLTPSAKNGPLAGEKDPDAKSRGHGEISDEEIVKAGQSRQGELADKSKIASDALIAAEAKFKLNAQGLRTRADSISAVLTRNVDEGIDVVCVIVGDPEPIQDEPAGKQPASEKPQ